MIDNLEETIKKMEEDIQTTREEIQLAREEIRLAREEIRLARAEINQAKEEGIKQVARNMLAKHLALDLISEVTGIYIAELEALKVEIINVH